MLASRLLNLALCLLFVTSFLVIPVDGGVNSYDTVTLDVSTGYENGGYENVVYPRGYTHRPVIAFYTSLSCPPCMSSADPAFESYWHKNGYEDGQPVTSVVFHLRAGGDGDDPLYHEDASAWAGHQNVIGTPTILIDEGYYDASSNEADIDAGVEKAGERSGTTGYGFIQGETFKIAEVEVYYLPSPTEFKIRTVVRYIDSEGGPLGPLGNEALNGFLNVFMVEDMVDAYSSELGENVTCHNAFRGFAARKESVVLQPEGDWSGEFTWSIPELDPNDNQVPIDINNLFPVAVLYDSEDTRSGGTGGWPGATRSINSATSISTAYDLGDIRMSFSEDISAHDKGTRIVVSPNSGENLTAAFLVYNTVSPDYNGTWKFVEMDMLEDGKASVELKEDGNIYYYLRLFDDQWLETRSDVSEVKVEGIFSHSTGTRMLIPILIVLLVLGAAMYVFRERLPFMPKNISLKEYGPVSEESVPVVDSETEIARDTEIKKTSGQ